VRVGDVHGLSLCLVRIRDGEAWQAQPDKHSF
jgi:hypothetical protein